MNVSYVILIKVEPLPGWEHFCHSDTLTLHSPVHWCRCRIMILLLLTVTSVSYSSSSSSSFVLRPARGSMGGRIVFVFCMAGECIFFELCREEKEHCLRTLLRRTYVGVRTPRVSLRHIFKPPKRGAQPTSLRLESHQPYLTLTHKSQPYL